MHSVILLIFAFGCSVRSAVLKPTDPNVKQLQTDKSSSSWQFTGLQMGRSRRSTSLSSLSINPKITTMVPAKMSSFEITVRLYGKSKVFLQIAQDGSVSGTTNCSSSFAELKLLSVGRGLQRLQGVATGRYVAMDQNGAVYTSPLPTDETVFRETMQSTSYHTFASAAYYRRTLYDTFLALSRTGIPKNGRQTSSTQNKAKFLIIDADSC